MRKKVDARIRTLVENCVKLRHRALFVIVGDKGRDQVVNLHYMLSKTVVKARPTVLWCYKKELHLSRRAAAGRRSPPPWDAAQCRSSLRVFCAWHTTRATSCSVC
jgi:tRNA(Met) C34 N-acetyltransferase TmcA